MIITETTGKFVHTYSDAGMKIRQIETGVIYDDAWDVKPYTYEETDEPIEMSDDATEEDYVESFKEMGVHFDDEE